MPRIARRSAQSCFFHIIVQGINKEQIFKETRFIEKYKEIILNKMENSKVNILAYCIMNNHAHFLIYSEKCEELSKFMQRLNTSYSQFYNKINRRVGYVFRDRYFSQEILSQRQLYSCLRYIHNNPVKACICKFMREYNYSSYNEFLGKRGIINRQSIELLFGTMQEFKAQFQIIHNNIR